MKATEFSVNDRVAHLVLTRPDRRNAWTGDMHAEYRASLQVAEEDPEIRAVVISGDPEGRAFCMGGDSDTLADFAEKGGYEPGVAKRERSGRKSGIRREFDQEFAYQFAMTTPIIAAVNGSAAGIGFAVACYADMRFIGADAKLTTANAKLGLPAPFGMSWLLPRLVGLPRALDLLLSARVFTGAEAEAWGLAIEAPPTDAVVDRAMEYATMLATTVSPISIAASKGQIYADQIDDVGTSVKRSVELMNRLMAGGQYAEGVAALREKRPPRF
ncbi:MAG: enoyl-CoA hydratase [Acidimicrobiales bacterium]|nr:enoyl-CoA hydratase [Acidimicrobiales bacterium]